MFFFLLSKSMCWVYYWNFNCCLWLRIWDTVKNLLLWNISCIVTNTRSAKGLRSIIMEAWDFSDLAIFRIIFFFKYAKLYKYAQFNVYFRVQSVQKFEDRSSFDGENRLSEERCTGIIRKRWNVSSIMYTVLFTLVRN